MVSRPFVLAVMISIVGLAVCARESARVEAKDATPSASSSANPVQGAIANPPQIPANGARRSDESAMALNGAHLLVASGKISDPDAPLLEAAMRAAYARMRDSETNHDGPSETTIDVGAQPAELAYSTSRDGAHLPTHAIIFLHGYGGRFALPCWQIAKAAREIEVVVACPDIGFDGNWATDAGESVVRKTVEGLRAKGVTTFTLAGLSNGAIGVSRLISRSPVIFASAILISGADATASDPHMPTLVLQGSRDAMSPAWIAQSYAHRAKSAYVAFDAGHFVMLTRAPEIETRIHDFLARDLTRR